MSKKIKVTKENPITRDTFNVGDKIKVWIVDGGCVRYWVGLYQGITSDGNLEIAAEYDYYGPLLIDITHYKIFKPAPKPLKVGDWIDDEADYARLPDYSIVALSHGTGQYKGPDGYFSSAVLAGSLRQILRIGGEL